MGGPLIITFFSGAKDKLEHRGASLLRFIDHTPTHKPVRTPLKEWSACRRCRCLYYTQQTQQTNIHAFSRIRTRDPTI